MIYMVLSNFKHIFLFFLKKARGKVVKIYLQFIYNSYA